MVYIQGMSGSSKKRQASVPPKAKAPAQSTIRKKVTPVAEETGVLYSIVQPDEAGVRYAIIEPREKKERRPSKR